MHRNRNKKFKLCKKWEHLQSTQEQLYTIVNKENNESKSFNKFMWGLF